jgi:uncharacterized protein YqeY
VWRRGRHRQQHKAHVASSDRAGGSSAHIAGAVAGLGAAEAQRRSLSAAEIDQIVQAEISERLAAAGDYERHGHADRAQRLRSEANALMAAMRAEAP